MYWLRRGTGRISHFAPGFLDASSVIFQTPTTGACSRATAPVAMNAAMITTVIKRAMDPPQAAVSAHGLLVWALSRLRWQGWVVLLAGGVTSISRTRLIAK